MVNKKRLYKVIIHYEAEIEALTKKLAIKTAYQDLDDESNWGLGIILQEDHTKAELIKECTCGQKKRCPQHSWAKNIKNCICGFPVNKYGLCTNPSPHGI